MRIFLCFCLAIYFLWRNSDGADVPVSEILSDTFISLSADSLGIFFGRASEWRAQLKMERHRPELFVKETTKKVPQVRSDRDAKSTDT